MKKSQMLSALVATLLSGAGLFAQDEEIIQLPAFSVAGEKDTSYVGKTSLSSTRIASDLNEVPQSVKVLNSSFLKAVNPTMLTDVLNYTGGAQNGQLNWTPGRLNIRGYTGEGDYNDGFAAAAYVAPESCIYDRFEIIKGPSTVFLAADGSPGGILNKITKSPLATASTVFRVQTGLYDGNHIDIDSTGAISGDKKLLGRVVAAQTYSNGYYDSTYMHRFTVMPMLSYQFRPGTTLTLKTLYFKTTYSSYNGIPIDPRTLQMFDVPHTTNASEDAPYNWRKDDVRRIWGDFSSRLNDHIAVHLAAMWSWDEEARVESTATTWNERASNGGAWGSTAIANYQPGVLLPRSTTADKQTTWYRSVQGDSNFNFDTGPVKNNFLVGSELRFYASRTNAWAGSSSGWDPFTKTIPTVTVDYSKTSAETVNSNFAGRLFALETMKLWDDRIILSYGLSRTSQRGYVLNEKTGAYSTPKYTVNKNLKQYGAVVKTIPGVNAFVGYNENFAVNGLGTVNGVSGVTLPPKSGRQWEVGLKGELFKKRMRFTVSYFDIVQKNNTVATYPTDPANPAVLVPGVISRGFDGDMSFEVSHNLFLMGSFALFDAKSVLGPLIDGRYIQPYTGQVANGSIPVCNNAEQTTSLYTLYKFTSGALHGLDVGLGYNYLSKRAITDGANQVMFGYVPGRLLFSGIVTYRLNAHTSFTLNLDNITNKKYIYSVRSENVFVPGAGFNAKFGVEYKL